MRSAAWISLLRVVPPELQAKLSLMSSSGNEINLQQIYRMEDEFMVIRGRMAGTTDAATVIFVPYESIDYVGFREEIKEPEVQAMFGTGFTPPPAARPEREYAAAPPPEAAPALEPPVAAAPAPPAPPPAAPIPPPPAPEPAPAMLPGKAALLERLRRSREPNKPG